MNPDTRIVINCYAGDSHLINQKFGLYTQHMCPIVTFSPEDAKVEIPGIESRFGGRAEHAGQASLDRHDQQLRMLLEFPEKYFLFHDTDSICLDAKIPDYLYAEPNHLWSNLIEDDAPFRQQGYYPDGFPKLAFQAPYFLSRGTIASLISVMKHTPINPALPFIDHYWVQLAVNAGVSWRGFPDGVTAPISGDASNPRCLGPSACEAYRWGLDLAMRFTRNNGGNIFHSVKDVSPVASLLEARRLYLRDGGDETALLPIEGRDWVSAAMSRAAWTATAKAKARKIV